MKKDVPQLTNENNYAIIRQIDKLYGAPVTKLLPNNRAQIQIEDDERMSPIFHYELLTSRDKGPAILKEIEALQDSFDDDLAGLILGLEIQQDAILKKHGLQPYRNATLPRQAGV